MASAVRARPHVQDKFKRKRFTVRLCRVRAGTPRLIDARQGVGYCIVKAR